LDFLSLATELIRWQGAGCKTRTLVANMPDGSTVTATITIADSVTEDERKLVSTDGGATYTAKQGVSTNGITDVTAQVIVGARF
jgi:hypothetical protein